MGERARAGAAQRPALQIEDLNFVAGAMATPGQCYPYDALESTSMTSLDVAASCGLSAAVLAAFGAMLILAAPAVSSTTDIDHSQIQPVQTEPAQPRTRRVVSTHDIRSRPNVVVASSDASCPRIRRKLWVENEGWVVRRVILCR
jgi:hypothetical protein